MQYVQRCLFFMLAYALSLILKQAALEPVTSYILVIPPPALYTSS